MIQRTRRRRLTSTAIANVAALCGPPDPGASGQPGSARRPALARATALELARTLAGDRPATAAATERIRRQEAQRGKLFFSDLLDAVCHHRFAPEEAERIWRAVVLHRDLLASLLGRNPGVVVAALDYLGNVSGRLDSIGLIAEADFAELASLALRDGMTGLFNHSACYELLDLELRRHRRQASGVCLLLLDIDDFKSYNELGGYRAGDAVLVHLARALVEEARDSDICCRLGGDEFVIIVRPVADPLGAAKLAERIRCRAAAIAEQGRHLAVSVGIASYDDPRLSAHAFVDLADRALRRAKTEGKDRVAVA